jgi:hypothetical protein
LIGLIRKGSKTVVGTAKLVDVVEITQDLAKKNYKLTGLTKSDAISCAGDNAWILEDVIPLIKPVPYIHTSQVIWVTLDEPTTKKILAEAKKSL